MTNKVKLATFGVVLAFISALSLPLFITFNNIAADPIYAVYEQSMAATAIVTFLLLGLCEGTAGIIYMIYTTTYQGVPWREYKRLWNFKVSRRVLMSSGMAAAATACLLLGASLAGTTPANILMALMVVIVPIFSVIILKERLPMRVIIGIVVVLVGCIAAAWEPPEASPNFYVGIILAIAAPFLFTGETIISSKGMEVTEPLHICGLYRMIGAAIIEILTAIVICLIAFGNLSVVSDIFKMVFSDGNIVLFLILTALAMCAQYGTVYTCWFYCGAARGTAVVQTGGIWSIPFGFLFAAMGIWPYHVTNLAIIGAVVVAVGVVLILAKPKDLFNLRKTV